MHAPIYTMQQFIMQQYTIHEYTKNEPVSCMKFNNMDNWGYWLVQLLSGGTADATNSGVTITSSNNWAFTLIGGSVTSSLTDQVLVTSTSEVSAACLLCWHHSHFTSMCSTLCCYGDENALFSGPLSPIIATLHPKSADTLHPSL